MNTSDHYYSGVNTTLLKALPKGLGHVLELGCAEGRLGAAYKHENPDAVWSGIDIHGKAVSRANTRIDFASCANANELLTDAHFWTGPFDCLVLGDVLEHLVDPATSLPMHLQLLKPSADVVLCVPNVQHWSTLLKLLRGQWDYQPEGLMDHTHLRFFTKDSICRLLESVGVKVTLVRPVIPRIGAPLIGDWALFDQFLPAITALQQRFADGEDQQGFRAYQYVIAGRLVSD